MNPRPKSGGTDRLRGVKATSPRSRVGPKQQQQQQHQQHKFRGTLESWLIKPRKPPHGAAEVCNVDMADVEDPSCHSTAPQRVDTEADQASDSGEDTQPLTPQSLEVDNNAATTAPSALASVSSEVTGRPTEGTEAEGESSRGCAKGKPRVTDFFQQSPWESPEQGSPPPEATWLGTPISQLRRMPECEQPLPRLRDCRGQHTVLIRVGAALMSADEYSEMMSLLKAIVDVN